MPTVTLAESAKLTQNDLIAGVIESVVTVDKFYELLPFRSVEGNSLAYNRENALGPVATVGVGDSDGSIGSGASGTNQTERQAAKNAATFTLVTTALTTIMGDAEVNGLIQATRSRETDQMAQQVSSKAKSAGRKYRDMFINGDGTNFQFSGLLSLVPAGQQAVDTVSTNGDNLSFEILDELIDLVKDKDGDVDYFQMPARTLRSYMALLRGLGGASIGEVVTLPSGSQVPAYRGIPIFRNDNIPTDQTKGTGTDTTTIFAGTLDDGSHTVGISGLTAANEGGMVVEDVGISETKDERIMRVKWYCGLALYSELGIASAAGILN